MAVPKRLTYSMLRRLVTALFVCAWALGAAALPAAPPPADAPVEQPDAPEVRGALKSLNIALRDGDGDKIRELMHARTPLETRMVDAMAVMAEAFAALHEAAVEKFGAENARNITGDNEARWAEGLARIDSAEVKIQGDKATVIYEAKPPPTKTASDTTPPEPPAAEEKSPPVVLRKVKGKWKLPVSQLAAGAEEEALEQRLAELEVQTGLVREVAEEIAAGAFKTAEEAAEAWHSRFMQSLGPKPREKKDDKPKRARGDEVKN